LATIINSNPTGVFALNGETGELFDVAAPARHQQQDSMSLSAARQRIGDLLAQWPISVEFKMSPLVHVTTGGGINPQNTLMRQCQSLPMPNDAPNINDDGQQAAAGQLANRCHLSKYNATNFFCSCDRFGFVALTPSTLSSSSQVPPSLLNGLQGDHSQWSSMNHILLNSDGAPIDPRAYDPAYMVNKPLQQQQQQQSLGIVTYTFVIVGVALLILSVAGLAVNVIIKLRGHSRLSKKHQNFFESMRDGPTTGPLAADHNLMGSNPLVTGAATTQSASIIGLATGGGGSGGATTLGPMGQICSSSTPTNASTYKAHQQLYSAHIGAHSPPMMEAYSSSKARRWPARLVGWLVERPSTWLSNLSSSDGSNGAHAHKTDRMIQHRVIGSNSSTIGTLAYQKSQYQNGYTTSPGLHNPIHQQHHQTIARAYLSSAGGNGSQSGVPLNPSSNSSYVSSSAYYEEIGSGNLTKVNANQLSGMSQPSGSSQQASLDPFMMKQRHYIDAQNHHQSHQPTIPNSQGTQQQQPQQHHQQVFHQWQTQARADNNNASTISFPPPIGQTGGQHHHPMSLITKQHLHNDLSPLQSSSSSSAGSQHSGSANPANGAANGSNGTTPRHFLFASPIAVNAYKQQQQQQQQQQQFRGHHHHHDQLDR
jgi:hypothetical protein